MMLTLQDSTELEESLIPKLKNILKKLESPKKNLEFENFKENIVYS
jgi:hypothetical protein